MSEARDEEILVTYMSNKAGKHFVHGFVSKKPYGYRSGGDQFLVYVSDQRARPDLFQPVGREETRASRGVTVKLPPNAKTKPTMPTPGIAPPQPPEPIQKNEDWRGLFLNSMDLKIGTRAFQVLGSYQIYTYGDLARHNREMLLAMKGIGPKTADTLLEALKKVSG